MTLTVVDIGKSTVRRDIDEEQNGALEVLEMLIRTIRVPYGCDRRHQVRSRPLMEWEVKQWIARKATSGYLRRRGHMASQSFSNALQWISAEERAHY